MRSGSFLACPRQFLLHLGLVNGGTIDKFEEKKMGTKIFFAFFCFLVSFSFFPYPWVAASSGFGFGVPEM